jgi:hypothetical protein
MNKIDIKTYLLTAIWLAGTCSLLCVTQSAAQSSRSFRSGAFALEIQAQEQGVVMSFSEGNDADEQTLHKPLSGTEPQPAVLEIEMDDLHASPVASIEAYAIKDELTLDSVSSMLSTKLGLPNVVITVSGSSVEAWQRWFAELILQDRLQGRHERAGRIVVLRPGLQDESLQIAFSNISILAVHAQGNVSNQDDVPRVTAELYVEGMRFKLPSSGQ